MKLAASREVTLYNSWRTQPRQKKAEGIKSVMKHKETGWHPRNILQRAVCSDQVNQIWTHPGSQSSCKGSPGSWKLKTTWLCWAENVNCHQRWQAYLFNLMMDWIRDEAISSLPLLAECIQKWCKIAAERFFLRQRLHRLQNHGLTNCFIWLEFNTKLYP